MVILFLTEEYQIVQEMNFSRSDLQDPHIIEKLLNKKKKCENITGFILLISAIITIVGSIITLGL